MTSAAEAMEPRARKRTSRVPREHGFWVMLSAMVLSAMLRNPEWRAGLAASAVVAAAVVVGGRVRVRIRRNAWLQLASALILAGAWLPIELAAGRSTGDAAINAAAWSSVFAAFTLGVWASTARSSRIRRERAGALTLLSIVVPAGATALFLLGDWRAQGVAALFATATMLGFALWRPGAKQLKATGLTLAACAAVVGAVLAIG